MALFFQNNPQFNSKLFNEKAFYTQFLNDLTKCQREVVIESPFITSFRIKLLYPMFTKLLTHNIDIYIITRDPIDHDEEFMRYQATNEILQCHEMGIKVVLLQGNYHRKLAIIDRNVLWEGSLNILSYSHSQEIMRRIEDKESVDQMTSFLKYQKLLSQG